MTLAPKVKGGANLHLKILRRNTNTCLQPQTCSGGALAVKTERELWRSGHGSSTEPTIRTVINWILPSPQ